MDTHILNKNVVAVIMAGGLGKRMETNIPKVLVEVNGIPMIVRIIQTLKHLSYNLNLEKIIIVVGKYSDQITDVINSLTDLPKIVYVKQEISLGTGHALMCCKNELLQNPESDVLILSGDVPMLSVDTMLRLISLSANVKLITTKIDNPTGYGRIILKDEIFEKIVEHADCNEEQIQVSQINSGIYCIKSKLLCNNFKYLKNKNKQIEYYLTDMIEIIQKKEKVNVDILNIDSENVFEILGVNTIEQLKELEKIIFIKNKKIEI